MNYQEALSILGLSNSATEEEIKKQFKKLSFEKHPDRNKTENSENDYKKISEAFNYLKANKWKSQPQVDPGHYYTTDPFTSPYEDIFNEFIKGNWYNSKVYYTHNSAKAPDIVEEATISFEESVLGCSKEVKYIRKNKCNSCAGEGKIFTEEPCFTCNGSGRISNSQLGFFTNFTCYSCRGIGKTKVHCEPCQGGGTKEQIVSIKVNIPGGVLDGNLLKLSGAGHYYKFQGIDCQSNLLLKLKVTAHPDMRISGENVVTTLNISLLEALKGTDKTVKTILGEKEIKIPAKSRHLETVSLDNHGVMKRGKHIFTLHVLYPEDVTDLISTLEK